MNPIVELKDLRHAYAKKEVLKGISFSIPKGEIFGLLGPNGSGKTTLFRILSTAMRPDSGTVVISGFKLPGQENEIRKKTAIVFQSPSLDGKLTVHENLRHQGHLYGLSGKTLETRIADVLGRLGIEDRRRELVDKLSGGLKRRVELAKGLLHKPEILILDEPSTGLDPGARINLWKYLKELRDQEQMTILVTTHLMEEAEHCDRIGIMNEGQLVALGQPEALKKRVRENSVLIKTRDPEAFAEKVNAQFAKEILSLTVRRPTLEDVFVLETGHEFWSRNGAEE